MSYLKKSLFDSVCREGTLENVELPPTSFMKRLTCPHKNIGLFVRTDHRYGPGYLAKNYSVEACKDCAKIIVEKEF